VWRHHLIPKVEFWWDKSQNWYWEFVLPWVKGLWLYLKSLSCRIDWSFQVQVRCCEEENGERAFQMWKAWRKGDSRTLRRILQKRRVSSGFVGEDNGLAWQASNWWGCLQSPWKSRAKKPQDKVDRGTPSSRYAGGEGKWALDKVCKLEGWERAPWENYSLL